MSNLKENYEKAKKKGIKFKDIPNIKITSADRLKVSRLHIKIIVRKITHILIWAAMTLFSYYIVLYDINSFNQMDKNSWGLLLLILLPFTALVLYLIVDFIKTLRGDSKKVYGFVDTKYSRRKSTSSQIRNYFVIVVLDNNLTINNVKVNKEIYNSLNNADKILVVAYNENEVFGII